MQLMRQWLRLLRLKFLINKQIEDLGGKPYAFIPQRNNIIQKNIVLNTSGISDLIGSELEDFFRYPKSKITLNCKKYQSHVWSKILKLEKRSIFNHKDYVFYNQITTDGFSCSLLFILKKYKDKEYGDKLPRYVEDEEIVKNINTLSKDECSKYLHWGQNYDKEMNRLPETIFKPICELNTDHIKAILEGSYCKNEMYLKIFEYELNKRKE